MNAVIKITSRLRVITQQQFIRNTCKISVEVDPDLFAKLENEEVKPRRHPGIIKTGRIELPLNVVRALERVIGDHPVKKMLNDCQKLEQYISARHPPVEQEKLNARMRKIYEEIDKKMPPEVLATLSEEEGVQWQHKREKVIRRVLAQRTYAWKPITYGAYEALVYAIGRGAKEYGVLTSILHEIEARDPDFQPKSYFDFGSGVGTGMWAASTLWKDTIFEYYNVDSSREMNDLSELIIREGNENQEMLLRNVYYRQFLPANETSFDLVISSYSLFELPSETSRKDAILNLWKKCNGYLIIVEEGTRRGSELVNEARDFVLNALSENLAGNVFAPCPHNLTCPRLADTADRSPCNFEVGYVPLHVGNMKGDHHTARYSYVVLKKGELLDNTSKWPRLVRPTLPRSRHVVCRMCTANAKLQEVIFTQSKHGRLAYRCAKASNWGDRLPIALGQPLPTVKKFQNKKSVNQILPADEQKPDDAKETIVTA